MISLLVFFFTSYFLCFDHIKYKTGKLV